MNPIWILIPGAVAAGWAIGAHMGRKPDHDPRSTRAYRRDAAMADWISGRSDDSAMIMRRHLDQKYPPGFLDLSGTKSQDSRGRDTTARPGTA